jgi:hypothetical protein
MRRKVLSVRTGRTYEVVPDGRGGYDIVEGGTNPLPGATGGFKDVGEALLCIRVLEHTDGTRPENSKRFWDLWYRVSGVTQRNRDQAKEMAAQLGLRIEWVDRHTRRWVRA